MKTHNEDLPLPHASRRRVARDMLVFQAKLFVDGIKDLMLSPLSLLAGLTGIFFGRNNPGVPLYELLRFGQRLEGWINLFSAAYPTDSARYGERKEHPEEVPPEKALNEKASNAKEEIVRDAPVDFDSLVDKLQATLTDAEARSELSEKSRGKLLAITKRLRGEQDQGHE